MKVNDGREGWNASRGRSESRGKGKWKSRSKSKSKVSYKSNLNASFVVSHVTSRRFVLRKGGMVVLPFNFILP